MQQNMNSVIVLSSRPIGMPTVHNFKFITEDIPIPQKDMILLKTLYVSVDPYLRGRMNDSKSYVPPFELNKPIQSGIIAEVVESNLDAHKKGDFVSGNLEWKEYQVSDGKGLTKIDDSSHLSSHLGILGMTGLTAYFGLIEIGNPKAKETLVISGAAGAVGSVVGQIGKLLGCYVVGITGTDEKVNTLKSKFRFDEAINYKTTVDLRDAIKYACPNGVDIYFDNVGGDISDAVLANINKHSRIVVCGAISLYNDTKQPIGQRVQPILLMNSATMSGFIISDFMEQFQEGVNELSRWLKDGKLINSETIIEGFQNIPSAFLNLFEGKNSGKMIVKV